MPAKQTKMVSERSRELSATRGMLYSVRDELKSEISEFRHETKAGFHQMNARFDKVMEAIAKMQLNNEQMADNNRITLEAICELSSWKKGIEAEVKDVRDTVRAIAKNKTPPSHSQ